jgi:hypothetical protein
MRRVTGECAQMILNVAGHLEHVDAAPPLANRSTVVPNTVKRVRLDTSFPLYFCEVVSPSPLRLV